MNCARSLTRALFPSLALPLPTQVHPEWCHCRCEPLAAASRERRTCVVVPWSHDRHGQALPQPRRDQVRAFFEMWYNKYLSYHNECLRTTTSVFVSQRVSSYHNACFAAAPSFPRASSVRALFPETPNNKVAADDTLWRVAESPWQPDYQDFWSSSPLSLSLLIFLFVVVLCWLLRHAIDGMGALKLNVLHWHLIDSTSFPIQSERFPQQVLLT